MTATTLACRATLALAFGVVILTVVGLVRARDVFGRLHYAGPINILGPLLLTVAFALAPDRTGSVVLRGALITLLLVATGPIVAHATARAARLRGRGTLAVRPEDAGAAR